MYKQTRIPKKSRHIRWNWEKSPESEELIRYHFVIVDDKNREGILNRIFGQIQRVNSGIEIIREREGKVGNSQYRYLFSSFDSVSNPNVIDFTKIRKPLRRDYDLVERKRGSIEDYVAALYK